LYRKIIDLYHILNQLEDTGLTHLYLIDKIG
jgi:hypothetical protein